MTVRMEAASCKQATVSSFYLNIMAGIVNWVTDKVSELVLGDEKADESQLPQHQPAEGRETATTNDFSAHAGHHHGQHGHSHGQHGHSHGQHGHSHGPGHGGPSRECQRCIRFRSLLLVSIRRLAKASRATTNRV